MADLLFCSHSYIGKPTFPEYGNNPWEGPYDIVKVNDNGTVQLKKGVVIETINIRLISCLTVDQGAHAICID